jgi:hypothetical protein
MRYADALTMAEDGVPILDLTKISALEADTGGERMEPGWTERKN